MSGLIAMTANEWETAAVGLLLALVGWFIDRRGKRIEIIVNGRFDALVARTVQLEDAMRDLGHTPPPDPNVPLSPAEPKE